MKKIFEWSAILLLFVAGARASDTLVFEDVSAETNAVATVTNAPDPDWQITGWLDSLIVNCSGAATGKLELVTLSYGSTRGSRKLLSLTNVASGAFSFPVRIQAVNTNGAAISGEWSRLPLFGDKLRLKLYGWSSAATATVYCITSRSP